VFKGSSSNEPLPARERVAVGAVCVGNTGGGHAYSRGAETTAEGKPPATNRREGVAKLIVLPIPAIPDREREDVKPGSFACLCLEGYEEGGHGSLPTPEANTKSRDQLKLSARSLN